MMHAFRISLPSLHDQDIKFPDGIFFYGDLNKQQQVFLSLSTLTEII